jgi:hypothetical protein
MNPREKYPLFRYKRDVIWTTFMEAPEAGAH